MENQELIKHAFTAIAICLPSLVNVLAMWPHLFSLAAALNQNTAL